MIWFERKAANSFSFQWQTGGSVALWQNWRSGKTCALAKVALWQNWRSDKTGALAKLALWQMDKKPKT
jgi:hypothetical protein